MCALDDDLSCNVNWFSYLGTFLYHKVEGGGEGIEWRVGREERLSRRGEPVKNE